MSGCSKGARGLFVLLRVLSILTETPISPSSWSRQRPDRYAVRAGRNLPDKEFRYLRTVIVTAAVYRGFASPLRPEGLTGPLNLPAPGRRQCLYVVSATSQTPVFLVNSRLGRFAATPFGSPRNVVHLPGAPLLPKLRGQFAEFLGQDSLERLRLLASPTCVGLRYGRRRRPRPRSFSRQDASNPFAGPEGPFGIGARPPHPDLPGRIDSLPPYIGLHVPTDPTRLRPSSDSIGRAPVREY